MQGTICAPKDRVWLYLALCIKRTGRKMSEISRWLQNLILCLTPVGTCVPRKAGVAAWAGGDIPFVRRGDEGAFGELN